MRLGLFAVFLLTVAKFVEADRGLVYNMGGVSPDNKAESEHDNFHLSYDEYPMIVPKRAALLLDRIMVALHHAMENEGEAPNELEKVSKMNPHRKIFQQYVLQRRPKEMTSGEDSQDNKDYDVELNDSDGLMDLERRGHTVALGPSKGRQYWRCYFNAVTCF